MREQIIELLGRGIPATQVASAVGCDDSYISQLLSSEDVSLRVQQLRAAHFSAFADADKALDTAEEEARRKLSSMISFITKPTEAARVFATLNAAKRRTDSATTAAPVAQTVRIDLPEAARVTFTMTHDRQVIEVGGRSMTTMPARNLAAQLESRQATRLLDTVVPLSLVSQKL